MNSTTTAPSAPRYQAPNIGVPKILNLRGLRFAAAGEGGDGGEGGNGGDSGWTPPASQADLDAIVQKRLDRERSKYADYDELKAKATAHDEAEAAKASDIEKAVKQAKTETETEVTARTNAVLISAEARALAAEAKFRNPADAVALLRAGNKLGDIKVEADGTVDGAALKALIDVLATERPYLLEDNTEEQQRHVVPGAGEGDRKPAPTTSATPGIGTLREAYAQSSSKKK